ncbi:zinc ribbon domain-containing protein [Opitutus sp. ER46]|uniref:zinc ribbon domain-containing protein n=1 Tax=Opitutus sp. ER46 TaxID=2161864 RepID=UPI000D326046|nr:zinc ribbon domain-containing protein [Opitutus sp. ER46]PTX94307.1 zinc ribbon domain-containing protein [Opitutus sp. ER46]
MPELPAPDECANCGARIPRGAKACPECGADERTGWRDSSIYDGLDLPESAYADENTPAPRRRSTRVNGLPWYWWAVAAALLVGLLLWWLGALR